MHNVILFMYCTWLMPGVAVGEDGVVAPVAVATDAVGLSGCSWWRGGELSMVAMAGTELDRADWVLEAAGDTTVPVTSATINTHAFSCSIKLGLILVNLTSDIPDTVNIQHKTK